MYVWDMSTRDCVHCFTDEGCLTGTTVAISPNGRYVACGSDSGVVNVYEKEECLRNIAPKPLRAVMNLTTSVENTCFNSTRYLMHKRGRERGREGGGRRREGERRRDGEKQGEGGREGERRREGRGGRRRD